MNSLNVENIKKLENTKDTSDEVVFDINEMDTNDAVDRVEADDALRVEKETDSHDSDEFQNVVVDGHLAVKDEYNYAYKERNKKPQIHGGYTTPKDVRHFMGVDSEDAIEVATYILTSLKKNPEIKRVAWMSKYPDHLVTFFSADRETIFSKKRFTFHNS